MAVLSSTNPVHKYAKVLTQKRDPRVVLEQPTRSPCIPVSVMVLWITLRNEDTSDANFSPEESLFWLWEAFRSVSAVLYTSGRCGHGRKGMSQVDSRSPTLKTPYDNPASLPGIS